MSATVEGIGRADRRVVDVILVILAILARSLASSKYYRGVGVWILEYLTGLRSKLAESTDMKAAANIIN